MKGDLPIDPRGLIHEAYRMEIGPEECRAIFLDWALGRGPDSGTQEIEVLLAHYAATSPEHPMTAVLRAGLAPAAPARRRGGWRGRRD